MKPPLSYSLEPLYLITVYVYDEFTTPDASATGTITVSILKADYPPKFMSLPARLNVREDVTKEADLFTLQASNVDDPSATLTYWWVSITPDDGKFQYDNSTRGFGYISNPGFNFDVVTSYQAVFAVTNGILTATSYAQIAIVQTTFPQSQVGTYSYTITIS